MEEKVKIENEVKPVSAVVDMVADSAVRSNVRESVKGTVA